MRNADAQRSDVVHGERASLFADECACDSDAFPLPSRDETLFDLLRNGIHGVSARREERICDLFLRGKERVLCPFRPPVRAEVAEHAVYIGAQRLVRTQPQLIQTVEIDVPHGVEDAGREKFKHGI